MDIIPSYLLSTAYGEQYRYLCQQIDRSMEGLPAAPYFLPFTNTAQESSSSQGNTFKLPEPNSKENSFGPSTLLPFSQTNGASGSTSDSRAGTNHANSNDSQGVPPNENVYSIPIDSNQHFPLDSIWVPPVKDILNPYNNLVIPSTLPGFRDEGINLSNTLLRARNPADLNLQEAATLLNLNRPHSGESANSSNLVLSGPSAQGLESNEGSELSGITATIGFGASKSDANVQAIFAAEAAAGLKMERERLIQKANRRIENPQNNLLDSTSGLQTDFSGGLPSINTNYPTNGNSASSSGFEGSNDTTLPPITTQTPNSGIKTRNLNSLHDTSPSFTPRSNKRPYSSFSNLSKALASTDSSGNEYAASTSLSLLCMGLAVLPSKWTFRNGNLDNLNGSLLNRDGQTFSIKDGVHITYSANSKPSILETKTLRTDNSIPSLCGVYYYEVEFLECSRDTTISIGFCTKDARLTKIPGHEDHTWGYHSDDACAISTLGHGVPYGYQYGAGDTIGCGIDFESKKIFYTKNGINLGDAFINLDIEMGVQNKAQTEIFGTEALNGASSVMDFAQPHPTDTLDGDDTPQASSSAMFEFFGRRMRTSTAPNDFNTRSDNQRESRTGSSSRYNRSGSSTEPIKELYPCIGFKPTVEFETNFGDKMFKFNIEQYINQAKDTVMDHIVESRDLPMGSYKHTKDSISGSIDNTDTSNSESSPKPFEGMQEEDVPAFIQGLVSSYFSYMGHLDTAHAFNKACNHEKKLLETAAAEAEGKIATNSAPDQDLEMMDVDNPSSNDSDIRQADEEFHILNRQKIGAFIISGKIEKAIQLLSEHYPEVLEDDESLVAFKLRCHKFIELAKKTFDNGTDSDGVENEVDTKMNGQEEANNLGNGGKENQSKEKALERAIEYGQELRERYKNHPKPYVQKRLCETFSLLAYQKLPVFVDQKQKKFSSDSNDIFEACLFLPAERYGLAEEVNAHILISLKKQPIPALKKMVQNTMSLVWDLTNFRGRSETSLLNIHNDYVS